MIIIIGRRIIIIRRSVLEQPVVIDVKIWGFDNDIAWSTVNYYKFSNMI